MAELVTRNIYDEIAYQKPLIMQELLAIGLCEDSIRKDIPYRRLLAIEDFLPTSLRL